MSDKEVTDEDITDSDLSDDSDAEITKEDESDSDTSDELVKFLTSEEIDEKYKDEDDEKDPLKVVDLILTTEHTLRPSYQDLSPSFADEVPFLVDGDSLLLTVMMDPNWSDQLGGSTLHLIYLFERYLNIFVQRDGTFHLVFFQSWRNIWKENWNILLYRLILIKHFSKNSPQYPVHLFENCYDAKFMQLVTTIRPGFIFTSIEAFGNCSLLKNIDTTILNYLVNIQLLWWLNNDIPCIDTNHIKIDISLVNGYYLDSNSDVKEINKKFGPRFVKFMKELPTVEECITLPKLENLTQEDSVRTTVYLQAAKIFYSNENENMMKILFLTTALMDFLELKNRCCPKFVDTLSELEEIVTEWHKCMFFALSNLEQEDCNWGTVSDLWQGLLFGHVCRFVSPVESAENLGPALAQNYEKIVDSFNNLGHSISAYPIEFSNKNINWETKASLTEGQKDPLPLLPVNNPLVAEFCGSIMHDIKWCDPPKEFTDREYTEHDNYHTMKVIYDEHDHIKDTFSKVPEDPWLKKKHMKGINLHAKYMTLYGASIEGRPLERSGVIRKVKNNKKVAKGKKEKKQKPCKNAQKIIDNQNEKKVKELETKEKEFLDKLEYEFKKLDVNYESLLNNIDITMNKIHEKSVYQIDALILKLNVLMKILNRKTTNERKTMEYKRKIYLTVRKILSGNPIKNIPPKHQVFLSKCLHFIGCDEIAKRNSLPNSEAISTDDSWIRFQLDNLGSDLIRETGGKPDPRVQNFIPDPWQKKLFDIVDKRQSALIVAPTSSGKTYASYYCMESVLREDTEGIVVYVAPTKALVNQVAATVYARFKDTDMPNGMSVYGVFTRDFRTYALNSQILVTVPQCLEILLMSPRRYSWVKRLRYVIFDEVHCIAGNLGAISFERCLLLIRCPFLALSATIRNPEQLHSWLQNFEDFKSIRDTQDGNLREDSYKVNLVVHSERHSDLIKYAYGEGQLHHLHPYANLETTVMNNHMGIPSHMVLSPAETIQLYDAMVFANAASQELKNLAPEIYFSKFPENGFIGRNLVHEYSMKLSELLEGWYEKNLEDFETTIDYLKPTKIDKVVGTGTAYILKNIVEFVMHLKQQNMLPAIVFAYNRRLVGAMTKYMTKYFRDNEVVVKRRDEKRDLKQDKLQKKLLQREAAKQKLVTKTKRNERRSLSLLAGGSSHSIQGVGMMTSDDMKFIERRLMAAGVTFSSIYSDAIRNGICLHHGGLGHKIRTAVEMLFRKRVLNVVFATGTLALGIHMPCKTTVIAGNSGFLNSLEYHQMAGRAGRRGYDTTGNVIFLGLNSRTQHSLLTAKLPDIKGNFPVTVTFILKLMLLVSDVTEKGKKSEEATKITVSRAMTVLEHSLCFMQDPKLKLNIKHFFSFSLQLLKMQEFINADGAPLKWCGLVTHLHYHEPGNLAFAYLLRTGAIRKICSKGEKDEIQFKLMIILSHLFTTIPLKSVRKEKFQNSIVILDPLPDSIRKKLDEYNREVLFVFHQYFKNIATHYTEDDNTLPLSSIKITGQKSADNCDNNTENIQNKFLNMCVPKLVCSPFSALSGNDDNNVYSSENLISNIKQKMSTDVKVFPLIDVNIKLNGYALDFYRHGIIESIKEDNGLKAGQEFVLITDFLLVLKTIVVSLEEMEVKNENDIVLFHFKKLEARYAYLHSKAFGSVHF